MTPSRLFAHRIVDITRQTRRQTLTRIAQISIGRPPTTTTTSPPVRSHPTPPRRVIVAGSWVGSGVGFPCFFFPFASPAADTHGDDRAKDSNNRRLSSRGIQELERELTDPPLSSPWAMADQSGVRNEGVEGRTVETPRYSPGRLMALRKSAIKSNHTTTKGRNLGWGWLSRLPSVRLPESRHCHGQLAIVSPSPSMICKTAIVVPNRSGRFITYHMATNRSNSIIPAPGRHHVAHSTDRDGRSEWRF